MLFVNSREQSTGGSDDFGMHCWGTQHSRIPPHWSQVSDMVVWLWPGRNTVYLSTLQALLREVQRNCLMIWRCSLLWRHLLSFMKTQCCTVASAEAWGNAGSPELPLGLERPLITWYRTRTGAHRKREGILGEKDEGLLRAEQYHQWQESAKHMHQITYNCLRILKLQLCWSQPGFGGDTLTWDLRVMTAS